MTVRDDLLQVAFAWYFGRLPSAGELADKAAMSPVWELYLNHEVVLVDGTVRRFGEMTPAEHRAVAEERERDRPAVAEMPNEVRNF
jgi:hypothetical protein